MFQSKESNHVDFVPCQGSNRRARLRVGDPAARAWIQKGLQTAQSGSVATGHSLRLVRPRQAVQTKVRNNTVRLFEFLSNKSTLESGKRLNKVLSFTDQVTAYSAPRPLGRR